MPKPVQVTKQAAAGNPKPNTKFVNAWDFQDRITMCLYGRSGTGKTTLWVAALAEIGVSPPAA